MRLARYAQLTLGFNLLVIVWGAFVRASKSGDGCGSHWPLCNGDVVPQVSVITTLVEFTHRVTSGLAGFLVLGLVIWTFRTYPKGHIVRRGAALSGVFIVLEALIGAVLVKKGLVADNDSLHRAWVMSLHLINTFLLLMWLALTAWWAAGREAPRLAGPGSALWLYVLAFVGMLVLGVSGAVAALGDTLFPARSLTEAFRQDLAPTAHILIRLRLFHPFIAAGVGAYLLALAYYFNRTRPGPDAKRWGLILSGLVCLQWLVGLVNVALLAPIWLQLLHLLLADLTWIALVLLTAATLPHTPALETAFRDVVPQHSVV
jgi:heme A synthase